MTTHLFSQNDLEDIKRDLLSCYAGTQVSVTGYDIRPVSSEDNVPEPGDLLTVILTAPSHHQSGSTEEGDENPAPPFTVKAEYYLSESRNHAYLRFSEKGCPSWIDAPEEPRRPGGVIIPPDFTKDFYSLPPVSVNDDRTILTPFPSPHDGKTYRIGVHAAYGATPLLSSLFRCNREDAERRFLLQRTPVIPTFFPDAVKGGTWNPNSSLPLMPHWMSMGGLETYRDAVEKACRGNVSDALVEKTARLIETGALPRAMELCSLIFLLIRMSREYGFPLDLESLVLSCIPDTPNSEPYPFNSPGAADLLPALAFRLGYETPDTRREFICDLLRNRLPRTFTEDTMDLLIGTGPQALLDFKREVGIDPIYPLSMEGSLPQVLEIAYGKGVKMRETVEAEGT